MILEIIGAKIALDVAASIATWCLNDAAENQRGYQRRLIASTRAELKAERAKLYRIEREARQAAWEARRAAHQSHFEMLNGVSDSFKEMADSAGQVLKQFQAISAQNRSFLKTLALTPEQRAAIHECNDLLARGCQRLHAYIGPYLRYFRNELYECREALRKHEFLTPPLPSRTLPESFPFSGELMEFEAKELSDYPFVDLGHGQKGRFITASRTSPRPEGSLVGIIDRFDRDQDFWIISAARGELAMDLGSGSAFREPRCVTLAEWRGDARIAWWQHALGEKVMLRFEEGSLSQRMRRAPWGTQVSAFVQSSDFFVRWIRIGERIARAQKHAGWTVPCSAPSNFWTAYAAATASSSKMLVREAGMKGDPATASLILRLATGHEYPIHKDTHADRIVVGVQCGHRLGLIQEAGRNLYVFLLQGNLTSGGTSESDVSTRLFSAIRESFAEQQDLALLAEADALELRKYRAVLQAEFEASKRRNSARVEFTTWSVVDSPKTGKFVVQFQGDATLPDGLAVRVVGEEEILGWSQVCEAPGLSEVVILRERRRAFRDEDFPRIGKLEATPMDRELLNKLDGIENFLSAAAAEARSSEDQQAFSILRRELLGRFPAGDEPIESGPWEVQLDEHQQRAVSLLAGTAPLVLIQGPPGTGKTHVLAHAINRILRQNPRARIAITSQANPAVDEAVAKIQESFPDLQIYRDYSAAAKEKYASLNRGVGIDQYHSRFIQDLEAAAVPNNPRAAHVQAWLKESMREDSADVEADMRQILAQGSQVLACTLSRLSGIAGSSPAFDLVIVDEAAKASVPEAMVAANSAKRLAMVGDHKQLLPYLDDSYYEHSAPTAADQNLLKDLWNNSLFSRLWEQAPVCRKAFLATMRRSRRPIAECISSCFYDGHLIPGRDDRSPTLEFPLSLMWIDSAKTVHEPAGKTSIRNRGEVELIFSALEELPQLSRNTPSVAVIAFHRGQAELMQAEIKKRKPLIKPAILTVDSSQGGQWDVVILTLARTAGGSGFIGNPNRLNVALSRAKELCIVVGSRVFAEKDRTEGSALSEVLRFVISEPKMGKWMVNPFANGAIPVRFGFPPRRRSVR
jgi:ATP-dependent RNA/DNA helicase IGHMBP2